MKCLTEVYGESAVATPDGKSQKKILIKRQNDTESL